MGIQLGPTPDPDNLGIDLILQNGRVGETYNIGGNNEQANLDTVQLVCSVLDEAFDAQESLSQRFPEAPPAQGRPSSTLITHVTDRAGHDRRYAINAEKISSQLGYKPRFSFETGIRKTVEWYLNNYAWWIKLILE